MGALCSLLIAVLAFELRLTKVTDQQAEHYGAALARMAAQQAVDAALNHDLVSLQVILQDVVSNPDVLLATIHDVENNLLVQAGNAHYVRTTETPLQTHTAPITLHDSVAGYVTVTLPEPGLGTTAVLTATGFIALLLLIIGGLSLYERRSQVFIYRAPQPPAPSDKSPAPDADSVQESAAAEAEPNELCIAHCHIRACNLTDLHQQLTAELYQANLRDFHDLLEEVLALYNGQVLQESPEGDYHLQFSSSENAAEAALRATCSAYLLMRLSRHLRPAALTLGAVITPTPDEPALAPSANTLLIQGEAADRELQDRLILNTLREPAGVFRLEDFRAPFSGLLERQYQQLRKLRG